MSPQARQKRRSVFPIRAAERTARSLVVEGLSVGARPQPRRARARARAGRRAEARARGAAASRPQPLAGQHVALLFEKPSLRTRSTFTIAVRELGGEVIEPPADVALGGRETVEDVARNLERWVHGAVVRTFAQDAAARSSPRPRRSCTSSTR